MEISETGMLEGITKLEAELQKRAAAAPAAWAAAAVTEQSDMLDEIAPTLPRGSGELAGSGFVDREGGAGFGSNHAWRIQDEFAAAVAERASGVAERMAERFDQNVEQGITPATAPSNWPETPTVGGARVRAGSPRQRAGAPRRRR